MNKFYEVTDTLLLWQTIGCLIGLCVSVVLVQLVNASWAIRSVRRPGILLSVALVAWNGGDLVNALLIITGFDYQSVPAKVACAFGYTGLTFLTWAVLGVWDLSIEGHRRRQAQRALRLLAVGLGAVITAWLWMDAVNSNAPLGRTAIRIVAETNLYLFVLIGMALALSSRPARTTRLCACITVFGVVGPVVAAALIPAYGLLSHPLRVGLAVYAEQSVNYVAVAAFILLARLRHTDVLLERVLQILSVILAGSFLWYVLDALLSTMPAGVHGQTALAVAVVVSITTLGLCAPALNRGIRKLTMRIFQQPDFDTELKRLSDSLSQVNDELEVLRRTEQLLLNLFELLSVQVVAPASVSESLMQRLAHRDVLEELPGSRAFKLNERDADALVPVFWNGHRLASVIAISRSPQQRGFLASEEAVLRRLAHVVAIRLAAIRAERANAEREQREAMLLHQTSESELRALRAQINPHFLFNALNTIADLIVVDTRQAERMTERLADVFRHVLTQSQKATVTVREEIEFLQKYLEIEEVRFRDRLRVRVDIDGATSEMKVPALILQPLVENAIKHGLAPKIEGGTVSISTRCADGRLLLMVEDDGVGFEGALVERSRDATNGDARTRSTGVGLANITQRLRTLYGEQAEMLFERPAKSGCRVTIKIPS
jgi:two-component system LytT family sensor kinase